MKAPRETSPATDDLIGVVLPKEKAGGVVAVGQMRPGEIYRVPAPEALRLVKVKRFEYATDEDRQRGIAHEAALAPAEPASPAAAPDTTED